ncbi:MAG: DUF370 domain-containing protein [Fimbriimonadales bacterium]|nr:DUF370 domain-containing protein [Fimbriimonadales bacterium]MDW8051430.1 DUF370 domain-containing protein [Armatimonadota bacterium]
MMQEEKAPAMPPLLNVGFYNFVVTGKIVALVRVDSAPVKRLVQQLRREGTKLIDATQGRRTRCAIFLSSGQVVLSALTQETLAKRLSRPETIFAPEAAEEELAEPEAE